MIDQVDSALHRSMLRTLAALPGLEMRRAVFAERLAAIPAAEGAALLHAIFCRALAGHPGAEDAALGFALDVLGLYREGRVDRVEALREAAEQAGFAAVAAVLAEGAPRLAIAKRGRLREVCIPEESVITFPNRYFPPRVGPNLHALEQMRLHPSPLFIGRLLRQRWIRTEDAVVIASRRPTTAALVHAIAGELRWMRRVEVRAAMALNPFTPTEVALCLLPTLLRPTLNDLRDGGFAAAEVRDAARLLLVAQC